MNKIKLKNPFKKKLNELKQAAAGSCKGCGEDLPQMPSPYTVREWCSRPRRTECRRAYHLKMKAKNNAR